MLTEIPGLLEWSTVKQLRGLIADCAFDDGKLTAGFRAKQVKANLQLRKEAGRTEQLERLVVDALNKSAVFRRVAIPRVIRAPMFSRYEPGMHYGLHVDDALMGTGTKGRTDLSVTVFLSDPGDYDGGELVVQSPYGELEIKLPAGSAVVYPSSTLHQVAPVARGERLAAVTWVESHVRDPAKREILHDLDRIRRTLSESASDSEETDLAFKTYANLLRMWSET